MTKQSIRNILFSILISMMGINAFAHDIEVKNADGVTIYYNFANNDEELTVTYRGSDHRDYKNEYSGTVVIPEEVTYLNKKRKVTCIGYYAFSLCDALISVTIPNSVTSIRHNAFLSCGITSISIPSSVTCIEDFTFCGCNNLIFVKIPNSVTTIGGDAFSSCGSLASVTIPNSVVSIGNYAFAGCSGLSSIIIGSGVTSIGDFAFHSTKLRKVIWLTNTPPKGSSNVGDIRCLHYVSNEQFALNNIIVYPFLSSIFEVNGIRYVPISPSERTCDAIDCTYDNSLVIITIPSTVTYQGISMDVKKVQPYVCYGNTYIENLKYEKDGEISQYAFSDCKNIRNVTLNENITSIGDYAFSGCSSLQSLVIPNSVTELGRYSFSGCTSLSKISIPKSVTTINNFVFSHCTGLTEFIIEDRNDELTLGSNDSDPLFSDCPLDYVYIGGNISYETSSNCGNSPFFGNTTLRKVIITDKETEISANEFYGCTHLQTIIVGDGVEKFGNRAFSGCTNLESLSFGTQLKNIGKEAFSDCISVTEITSKAITPPDCDTQALDDINKWNCKLYIPKGCMSSYMAADQWKEFFFIAEGEGKDMPDNPTNKKCAKPIINYNKGELFFASDTDGVEFISTISDTDIASYTTSNIHLGVTYNISVYATKSGYENSETVTATLCWIDVEPNTDGIYNDVTNVRANAILIQSHGGLLTIEGAENGTPINIYDINGFHVGSAISNNGPVIINTNLPTGSNAIVKIGDKNVKIVVK